jgi:hypothetical protein
LVGQNTNSALSAWTAAGFTGTMTFLDPLTKPPWQIGWQSLTPATTALCTSGISVAITAPP